MKAQRIRPANGVWYEIECECQSCRHYGICTDVAVFIQASPKHWRFMLRRASRSEAEGAQTNPETEALRAEVVRLTRELAVARSLTERATRAEAVGRQLFNALNRIYCEELNGHVCTMPEFSSTNPKAPREHRCCDSCRGHWQRARVALDAFADLGRFLAESASKDPSVGGVPGEQT